MPTPGSSPNGWSNRLWLEDALDQFATSTMAVDIGLTSGAGAPAGLGGAPRSG
jgi:hypothetical protein